MKNEENRIKEIIKLLVGQCVQYVTCEAEILDISFDKTALHISSFGRIRNQTKVLVTTNDYQSWDEIDSVKNDEWINVKKYKDQIIGGRVLEAIYSSCGDLFINLDNDIVIECFLSNGEHIYDTECEEWVLFGKDNNEGKFYLYRNNTGVKLITY